MKPPDNAIFNLASKIHLCRCNLSHTDQCGWYYFDFDPEFRSKDKSKGRNRECLEAEENLIQFKEVWDIPWDQIINIMSIGMTVLHKHHAIEFERINEEFPL